MLCPVECVTVVTIFGSGTNGSMVTSWYQHLLHHKSTPSSPKDQGERKNPYQTALQQLGGLVVQGH